MPSSEEFLLTMPNSLHSGFCVAQFGIATTTVQVSPRCSGYWGYTARLPNSLLSDDGTDPEYTRENPLADFQRSEVLRQAATRAWAAQDNRTKLLKSSGTTPNPTRGHQRSGGLRVETGKDR